MSFELISRSLDAISRFLEMIYRYFDSTSRSPEIMCRSFDSISHSFQIRSFRKLRLNKTLFRDDYTPRIRSIKYTVFVFSVKMVVCLLTFSVKDFLAPT